MKNHTLLGLAVGFVVGAATAVAGAVAVDKVSREIKEDLNEYSFTSPDCNNIVTLSKGSSETAKGLTVIKIKATTEGKEDECKLVMLAGKNAEILSGEWTDNDHFELIVGKGKRLQCCDVSFDEEEIKALYYFKKITLGAPEENEPVEDEVEEAEDIEETETATEE